MAATPKASATAPKLVSADAQQIIEIAKSYGALGWR
jgi:hypothetical protein